MNTRLNRACQGLAVLLTSVMALFGLFGSPAGATPGPDDSSSSDNYTFEAIRSVDTNGTATYADDVTTFTYTLVAAPGTDGGEGISHAVFAAFCVTPTGYDADQFDAVDPSTDAVGFKTGSLALGASLSFSFDGNYDADADAASIVIKQGDNDRTVTVAGPACPANEDPFTCPDETVPMTDVNGDGAIDQADCDYEPPFTCPGETVPMTDGNGDGAIDLDDCEEIVVVPEGPVTPTEPTEPETPAAPTAPVVEVEDEVVAAPPATPTVAPTAPTPTPAAPETPAAVDATEVLGSQVTAGTLPRTGAETPVLAALGALLLLAGASLRRVSRGMAEA